MNPSPRSPPSHGSGPSCVRHTNPCARYSAAVSRHAVSSLAGSREDRGDEVTGGGARTQTLRRESRHAVQQLGTQPSYVQGAEGREGRGQQRRGGEVTGGRKCSSKHHPAWNPRAVWRQCVVVTPSRGACSGGPHHSSSVSSPPSPPLPAARALQQDEDKEAQRGSAARPRMTAALVSCQAGGQRGCMPPLLLRRCSPAAAAAPPCRRCRCRRIDVCPPTCV